MPAGTNRRFHQKILNDKTVETTSPIPIPVKQPIVFGNVHDMYHFLLSTRLNSRTRFNNFTQKVSPFMHGFSSILAVKRSLVAYLVGAPDISRKKRTLRLACSPKRDICPTFPMFGIYTLAWARGRGNYRFNHCGSRVRFHEKGRTFSHSSSLPSPLLPQQLHTVKGPRVYRPPTLCILEILVLAAARTWPASDIVADFHCRIVAEVALFLRCIAYVFLNVRCSV